MDAVDTKSPTTLGAFILAEMNQRDMSAREFAEFIGVSHSVINKFLNHGLQETYGGKPIGEPSIEFLVKLSSATRTDISTLIGLVKPGAVSVDPDARLLAERISRLPPDKQAAIDALILGLLLKENQ